MIWILDLTDVCMPVEDTAGCRRRGHFSSFVSVITDAELKQINWEFSRKPCVEHSTFIDTHYEKVGVEIKKNNK